MKKIKGDPERFPDLRRGLWSSLERILIAALDRGQFPFAMITVILVVLITHIPEPDLAIIIKDILRGLYKGWLVGWILSIVIGYAWWSSLRSLEKSHVN